MNKLYLELFNTFKFLINMMPSWLILGFMKSLTSLIYMIDKKHRNIAKVNLDLAYEDTLTEEEKEKIIKKCYLNLGLSLVDFVKNQGISKEDLLSKITLKNEHILQNALKEKRKIILITAHYGNWELLPLSLAAVFAPLTGVGRKLDTDSIDVILKQNREQFDIQMLDKKGAMKDMISVLKQNRLLGLLVDQNTSEKEGILVNFFNKPVRHTPSAAILARRFDALIIPAFITTEDHQEYTLTFYEPIVTEKTEDKDKDILDSVQKQAKITEEVIRMKPQEWFWLHKRWKNQFEENYK